MARTTPYPSEHDTPHDLSSSNDQPSETAVPPQATSHGAEPQPKKPGFLRRLGFVTADPYSIAEQFSFVANEAVLPDLDADNKQDAIGALVGRLAEAGVVKSEDLPSIVAAVLQRETVGSTGIGRGLALPHAKHAGVKRVVAAVGYSSRGIDFNSLDREDVHLIVLVLSPPDRASEHLQALSEISRYFIQQGALARTDAHSATAKRTVSMPLSRHAS